MLVRLQQFIILVVLALLSSCSNLNVDYHMTTVQFETPETRGKLWNGQAEIAAQTTHKVSLARAHESYLLGFRALHSGPTVESNVEIDASTQVGVGAGLSVWKRIDIFFKNHAESTSMLGAKFQFYGSPEHEPEEGLKIAVLAAYGAGSEEETGDEFKSQESSLNFESMRATIELEQSNFAFLVGHRSNEHFIIYSSTYYSHYDVDSHLSTGSGAQYDLSTWGDVYGTNVGIKWNTAWESRVKLMGKVEAGYSIAKLKQVEIHDMLSIGTTFGIHW